MWTRLPSRRLAHAALAMLRSGQLGVPTQRAACCAAVDTATAASYATSGLRGFAAAPLAELQLVPCRLYSKKSKKDKKGQPAAEQQQQQAGSEEGAAWDPAPVKSDMERSLEHLQHEFASLRSGRATPGMFDHLKADVYGEKSPFRNLGTSSVKDAHLLSITVFDPTAVPAVEKALRESALKLNPRIEGQEVLVPIPKPTPDSVAAMVKLARVEAEDAKVSIRLHRKRAMDAIKSAISGEDERKRAEKEVQKLTDGFIQEVDRIMKIKEKELSSML